MSNTVKLRESNVPNSFKLTVAGDKNIKVTGADQTQHPVDLDIIYDAESHKQTAIDLFDIFFSASADIISADQFKDMKSHAVTFNDKDGNNLCSLISNYDDDSKTYNAGFTFDPEDLNGISTDAIVPFDKVKVVDKTSGRELTYADVFDIMAEMCHGYCISDHEIVNKLIMVMLNTIRNYLDVNASDVETVELLIDGPSANYSWGMTKEQYQEIIEPKAIASVEVVKGNKHFSISFSEELKAKIKGNEDQMA